MIELLNTLVPVFLIILLGAALRHGGFIPRPMAHWANRLTYWVGLPALLFLEAVDTQIAVLNRWDLLVVLLGGTLACIGAGYAAAHAIQGSIRSGELIQSAFRGNLAFIGLPVIAYSMQGDTELLTLAVLLIVALILFYNVVSVVVMIEGWHHLNRRMIGLIGRRLSTHPLVLACLLGLIVAGLGYELPTVLRRSIEPVGRMALPLALISIGAMLDPRQIHGFEVPILAASLIKVALAPLAGFAIALALGASGEPLRMTLILLACPTASTTFILAEHSGGGQLTAGAIVASTLLSLFTLGVVLSLPMP